MSAQTSTAPAELSAVDAVTERLDRYLTHPVYGILAFVGIMCALYQRQRTGQEERQADEDVRRHPAHCRQRLDLARELLPVAHGVANHVEEPCK